MTTTYLDRLKRCLEILAAKRTPQQKAEDARLLKEKGQKQEEKLKQRREKEGRSDTKVVKDKKPDKKIEKIAEDIKNLKNPCLFFVNSNITSMEDDDSKDVRDKAKALFQKFLTDDDHKEALENSYNLLNLKNEGVHVWIGEHKDCSELSSACFSVGDPNEDIPGGLECSLVELNRKDLTKPNPFKNIKIAFDPDKDTHVDTSKRLKGIEKNESEIRSRLIDAWKPIEDILVKQPKTDAAEEKKDKKEQETEEQPEDIKKEADENKEDKDEEADNKDEEEKGNEDKDEETTDEEYEHHINPGSFRSIKDPWILILDPRRHKADFQAFVGPDESGEPKKASVILPKAQLLLVSKKLKMENEGVRIYFLAGKDAHAIKAELQKGNEEIAVLGPFDKSLLDRDEPFTGLKIDNKSVDPALINEMNRTWMDATSSSSGNPISAIQANTSIPLDYFRFLNRKQRPIELYLGGHPRNAGSEGTVYVLASVQESKTFLKIIKRFKMPSLFYERMSANSDIDAEFKMVDPEKYMPANVLILKSDKFDPKAIVEANDNTKKVLDKPNVTQLDMLHAFAKRRLGSRIQTPGTYIKGKYLIGTHVVQFNQDMTTCFVWGSLLQHVKIDPKDVLEQLPFVKDVITSYL